MSTVLSESNGVISEERFQKLTPIQWVFQYRVAEKNRRNRIEDALLINDLLAEDIETLAMVIDPKIGERFITTKKEYRQKKAELRKSPRSGREKLREVTPDNINIHDEDQVAEIMRKYYDTAPDTISPPKQFSEKHRFVGETFSREDLKKLRGKRRFITMGETEKDQEEDLVLSLRNSKKTKGGGD